MQVGRTLAALMRDRELTQEDVAEAALVSQSTISRLLTREPSRSGAAYRRVCSYIHAQGRSPFGDIPYVGTALNRTWDGSDAHALALAELIEASHSLWPNLRKTED